jgi:NAD(P)-dependent dehydrogenase (short-subunit alcohol dehydrogenase family)
LRFQSELYDLPVWFPDPHRRLNLESLASLRWNQFIELLRRRSYSLFLLGRTWDLFQHVQQTLAAEGITAAAFTADLVKTADLSKVVSAIQHRFGSIDVLEYAPITAGPFTPAMELTLEKLQDLVALYLFSPVELVRLVLPGMLERGDGGILIVHGGSAVQGMPFMSGVGVPMAAARNYVYSLNGEIADRGVYAGTLSVMALINGSEGHRLISSGELPLNLPPGYEIPVVGADELAEQLWGMFTRRDRSNRSFRHLTSREVRKQLPFVLSLGSALFFPLDHEMVFESSARLQRGSGYQRHSNKWNPTRPITLEQTVSSQNLR